MTNPIILYYIDPNTDIQSPVFVPSTGLKTTDDLANLANPKSDASKELSRICENLPYESLLKRTNYNPLGSEPVKTVVALYARIIGEKQSYVINQAYRDANLTFDTENTID